MSRLLDVEQDYDMCDDGELCSPMDVYWVRGHGHDPDDVIRAVVEHCIELGDIPRIGRDDGPVEMWQQNVKRGGSVEYRRTMTGPDRPHSPLFPITIMDLDRRTHGGHSCSVRDCKEPWSSTPAVPIAVEVDGDYMAVDVMLCRTHSRRLPGPSYRMRIIPVGATILLPDPEAVAR